MIVHGLFKEPIIGPIKSKMAEIRHIDNRFSPYFIFYFGFLMQFGL